MATSKTKPGKKTPARKKKTTTTKKNTTKHKAAATKTNSVSQQDRHQMIQEAAYYIAEARGFGTGDAMSDWLIAETQIDSFLLKQ